MAYLSNLYKIINNKFYFRISYLLINLFTITILRFIPGIHIVNKLIILWGIFLICTTISHKLYNKCFPSKIEFLVYLFLVITLLFTLIKYPTIDNIKEVVINFIILLLFFDIAPNKNKQKLTSELKSFSYIYCGVTFLLSFVSLFMIFFKKTIWISETLNGEYLVYSFYSAFTNENSLGIASVISLILSLYILSINKFNLINKCIILLNILLQSVSLVLSNARSVYLALITFILFFLFMYLKNKLIKTIFIVLPILSSIIFFIIKKDAINSFLTGRDILWRISLKIMKDNPIFGSGTTYLTNKMNEMKVFTLGRLHNIYLEVGAVNGIVSLCIFLLLITVSYLLLFKKINNLSNKTKLSYIILFSLCTAILCINLVESSLIYIISFISIIFWTLLSYMISIFLD